MDIFEAIKISDLDFVKLILSSGGSVNCRNKFMQTPLQVAISEDEKTIIQYFLSLNETDLDTLDLHGNSALNIAIEKNNIFLVKKLLEKGAKIHINYPAISILDTTAINGNLKAFRLLLEYISVQDIDKNKISIFYNLAIGLTKNPANSDYKAIIELLDNMDIKFTPPQNSYHPLNSILLKCINSISV